MTEAMTAQVSACRWSKAWRGFTGAGSASLDGLLGWDSDPAFATAAVLVGISGAVIALTGAQRALDEDAAREAAPRELVPDMQRPRRAA